MEMQWHTIRWQICMNYLLIICVRCQFLMNTLTVFTFQVPAVPCVYGTVTYQHFICRWCVAYRRQTIRRHNVDNTYITIFLILFPWYIFDFVPFYGANDTNSKMANSCREFPRPNSLQQFAQFKVTPLAETWGVTWNWENCCKLFGLGNSRLYKCDVRHTE